MTTCSLLSVDSYKVNGEKQCSRRKCSSVAGSGSATSPRCSKMGIPRRSRSCSAARPPAVPTILRATTNMFLFPVGGRTRLSPTIHFASSVMAKIWEEETWAPYLFFFFLFFSKRYDHPERYDRPLHHRVPAAPNESSRSNNVVCIEKKIRMNIK